jgi:tetratricopeptide (TPR) repeat protein
LVSTVTTLTPPRRYNAHRGNIDEDSSLLSIACDILQESSLRSADGRTLGTPDTTCWIVIDAVDDLFGAVVQEHKITFHKRPDRVVYVPSVDRRPPMQANNSPHVLPTHHQQLRDTDMENCASLLQHGCRLACENRPIEALAKLQQAKDLVSAFKQPTSASVALFISASLYLGHLYLTQGLVDAASAAFHAVSQWAKEFEGLFVDSLLLGRLEFGLATVETGASEVKTQHYQRALKLFESNRCPEVPETNDWWAITQLKLSDAYLHAQPHDIPAAAAALQHALDHFQAQKTSHAHFHTARALYKRALIFDAEGNSMMKMAFQAAAKELWIHTVGTDDTVGQSLTLDDFDDKILEPWFK